MLGGLFGRRKGEKGRLSRKPVVTGSETARCEDAHLELQTIGSALEFGCTFNGIRMFRIDGRLGGSLAVTLSPSARHSTALQLSIPLQVDGQSVTIEASCIGHAPDSNFVLQSWSSIEYDDDRSVEFVFGHDAEHFVYTFNIPAWLKVRGLPGGGDDKQPPITPPPVRQMAALLRETVTHRRYVVRIMEDLCQDLSPSTVDLVARLRVALRYRPQLESPQLRLVQDQLSQRKQPCSPSLVAALCLLVDMEMGALTRETIEAISDDNPILAVSWAAIETVTRFLGAHAELDTLRHRMRQEGFPVHSPTPSVEENALEALSKVQNRMQERDAASVLWSLLASHPSQPVARLVHAWRLHPEAEPPLLEGLDAFAAWLAHAGVRLHHSTIMAFALFVEAEAGRLSPSEMEEALRGARHLTLSPYSMAAVAGAFVSDVLALRAPEVTESVARLAQSTLFLGGDPVAAHPPWPEGFQPNGMVLLANPHLVPLSAEQVARKLNHPMYLLYGSEADERRVLKRPDGAWQNVEDGMSVLSYAGRAIEVPHWADLPERLTEISTEHLLGQRGDDEIAMARLELLTRALPRAFSGSGGIPLSSDGRLRDQLRHQLEAPRTQAALRQALDPKDQRQVAEALDPTKGVEVVLSERLHSAIGHEPVQQLTAVALSWVLTQSVHLRKKGSYQLVDETWFRTILRSNCLGLLDNPSPLIREVGCWTLGTNLLGADRSDRTIVEYELQRMLDDAEPGVALEAASALTRVALQDIIDLPAACWTLESGDTARSQSTEIRIRVQQCAREMWEWHDIVTRGLTQNHVSMKEFVQSTQVGELLRELEAPPPSGLDGPRKGDPSLLADLAWTLGAARQALRRQAAAGWMWQVVPAQSILQWFYTSARAWQGHKQLSKGEANNEKAFLEHLQEQEQDALIWPRAAGLDPLTFPVPQPPNEEMLWLFRQSRVGGTETSPLLSQLLITALAAAASGFVLVRYEEAAPPRPLVCALQVLDVRKALFVPLLQRISPDHVLPQGPDRGSAWSLVRRLGGQDESAAVEEALVVESDTMFPSLDATTRQQAANALVTAFSLPAEAASKIRFVLEGAASHAAR